MTTEASVLRVAVVGDHAVAVSGLTALLADQPVEVSGIPARGGPSRQPAADVLLYDPAGPDGVTGSVLRDLRRRYRLPVVAWSWETDPEYVHRALADGASGYLTKSLTGGQVATALARVRRGEVVVVTAAAAADEQDTWPGQDAGLSQRESEIIALITAGLSNAEIATQTYLSINSVKTYIRSAYHKMDVVRRSQAVRWAVEHGFDPEASSGSGVE